MLRNVPIQITLVQLNELLNSFYKFWSYKYSDTLKKQKNSALRNTPKT